MKDSIKSKIEHLNKTKKMLDDGLINEKEFALIKKDILGNVKNSTFLTDDEKLNNSNYEHSQTDLLAANKRNYKYVLVILTIIFILISGYSIYYFKGRKAVKQEGEMLAVDEKNEYKLTNQFIWETLYPGNQKFDYNRELIKKIDDESETRTILGNIFYYRKDNLNKAAVIFFTNTWTSGKKEDCHACVTQIGIAIFVESPSNNWVKTKFVENWDIPQEGYGTEPRFQLKQHNNMSCLYIKIDGVQSYQYYYDIESLKQVK